MNNKIIGFIKIFSYTASSNFISVIISSFLLLIVPKLIGVEEYSYWQLFLFYSSYVGFFHLGWNDGIYLRYGGAEYKGLDKELFFSQFYMLFLFQLLIATIIFVGSEIFIDNKVVFIFKMTAVCLLITNVRFMLLYILQCTNRIKEYARITIVDRILYCCLIIIFLMFGSREYEALIVADLIGRFISLLYAVYYCNEIVLQRFTKFEFTIKEAIRNISIGIKLMFANLASILIIGVVRFGIEHSWDVLTFGKVSLTLSVSNLMLLFINALGIIMFPILRRTDQTKLSRIYVLMRDLLMVILFGALILYYPFKYVLSAWLPQYADALKYMALVFPICVFEGKMALLINTYLKTLRKETLILKINLVSLAMSIIITCISVVSFKNLELVIFSIIILLAFRSVLAEMFLSKILRISLLKDIVLELMLALHFIITAWYIHSWLVVIIYTVGYIIYLGIKHKDIASTMQNISLLMRTRDF